MPMISVEDALERILNTVHVLEPETRPILSALGQVLAEDVVAGIDIPPHDNSAMDGFAVLASDTYGASQHSPIYLNVIGEVAAGYTSSIKVTTGTAVRIMTGAPLPDGADAVVQFEKTDETVRKKEGRPLDTIGILEPATPGLNIRPRGEDIRAGAGCAQQGYAPAPCRHRCTGLAGKCRGCSHPPPRRLGAFHR